MACNGKEAIEAFKQQSVDLIFMDMQMPVVDGYSATRAIRSIEGECEKRIPIVALTAYTWLLRVCRPAHVATYAYVNPIVAILLGHWFAGESMTSRTLLAATLIVVGVLLVTLCRKAATIRPPSVAQAAPATPSTSAAALGAACRTTQE